MKERPILFSGPMVRAILEGRKTVTRRVVKPQPPTPEDVLKISGSGYSWAQGHWMLPPSTRFWPCGPVWAVRDLGGPDSLVCPYGAPGDRLWVRETFQPIWASDKPGDWETGEGYAVKYMATDARVEYLDDNLDRVTDAAKPSIHMPRWASRITLEVTGVRVERLQEISEEQAKAEGCADTRACVAPGIERPFLSARNGFSVVWEEINAARGFGWDANPFVWVVEFKRLS
jgi:hypothetical protein